MSKDEGSLLSAADDSREDQMKLLGFQPKQLGLFGHRTLGRDEHLDPVLGFAGLFLADGNLAMERLSRDGIVGFAAIGPDACGRADKLANQRQRDDVSRNCLGKRRGLFSRISAARDSKSNRSGL
jgi:hypothetical protein